MVEGFQTVDVCPLPKSHTADVLSTLFVDKLVKFTKFGGLKQLKVVGVADAAAKTSNTDIAIVVSSVHPKLSATVSVIL